VRRAIIPLTLALVLAFAAVQIAAAGWGAGAQPDGGKGTGDSSWVNLAEKLDLTGEQSAKIEELQAQHFKKMNPLQDQLRSLRQEMRQLRFQRGVDEAQVRELAEKAAGLRDEMHQERATFRTELENILTDEQLAKWSELRGGGFCPNPNGPRFSKMRGGPAQ